MTTVRKGFSLYLTNSALYGHTFELDKGLLAQLVMWADTTPGVTGYAIESISFDYATETGKPRVAKLPLQVSFGGRTEYWDLAYVGSADSPSTANKVIAAHAKQLGLGYFLFDANRLDKNYIEKKNRQTAQSYLYLAHGTDYSELETRCLMALVKGGLTIQALARLLGVSEIKMYVAALRLWLARRVQLPMKTEYLQPSWNVSRVPHVKPNFS